MSDRKPKPCVKCSLAIGGGVIIHGVLNCENCSKTKQP